MGKLRKLGKKIAKAGRKILTIVKKVTPVLNWVGSDADKIYKAKHIKTKMTGNTRYPIPYPTGVTSLVDFGTHITTWDNAITAALPNGGGTAEAAHLAGEVVHADILTIMPMVQIAMEDDAPNAIQIATDAGFETKDEGSHGPRKAEVFQCTEPGCLIVNGEGQGQHDWQKSYDGGKTFENLRGTTGGVKEITGEKSDVRVWFRSCQVLSHGEYGPWGPWVSGMPL